MYLITFTESIPFFFFLFAEALVTLDVHSRDVLVQLYEQGVNKVTDFKWLCQLRYYWIVSRFKYIWSFLLVCYNLHLLLYILSIVNDKIYASVL